MSRKGAWGYRCTTCRVWVELTKDESRTLTLQGAIDLACPHCGVKHRESLAAAAPPPAPMPLPPVQPRVAPEAVPWKVIVPESVAPKASQPNAAPPPWEANGAADAAPLPFARKPSRTNPKSEPELPPPRAERAEPDDSDRPPPRPRRSIGERLQAVPKVVQMAALFTPLVFGGVAFIALTSDSPAPPVKKSKADRATPPTARETTP